MEIYLKWLDDLINVINKNKQIQNYPCIVRKCLLEEKDPTEISIQVIHNLQKEKNLIIDSTCFRKYFEAVVEPVYNYQQSINDASKNCIKYIKDWMDN